LPHEQLHGYQPKLHWHSLGATRVAYFQDPLTVIFQQMCIRFAYSSRMCPSGLRDGLPTPGELLKARNRGIFREIP
jgi:hypothetical protein